MATFFTVKEAARLTGKSPSSIRRIIYPIIETDQHVDRPHIQPNVDEVIALRSKGENFAWRISEELLRREVPEEAPGEQGSERAAGRQSPDAHMELLSLLRQELGIKNQQITQQGEMLARQMELIDGLSERLREGNVLIGSLQHRLALTDGSQRMKSSVVEANTTMPGAVESPAKTTPKPTTKALKPTSKTEKPRIEKPKKGFFARLFR
ncbi:MAG: hypothetical protein HZA46_16030 [Planctomycetales bacterium]|nr:hypothetical protein [Planctomycetales bacterium]